MTSTPPSHVRAALLGLAGLVLAPALPACKPASKTARAPMVVDDDIEAIERQLADNADNLRSEGIVIARAEAKTATTPIPTPTQPDLDDATEDEGGGDGDEVLAGETETTATDAPEMEEEPIAMEPSDDAPPARSIESTRQRRADRRYIRARKKRERTRCERICDLAEATCDLAEQVCSLADRHVDEVRYEDACERAAGQCRLASTACTNCED